MQTSYSLDPAVGREGVQADSRTLKHIVSRCANGIIKAGKGVFSSTGFGQPGSNKRDPGSIYQNPTPGAAALATALLTGGASSASIQTITSFNGTNAAADMTPARKVTMVLSSHANWDATVAVLTGVNHLGLTVSENLTIPDAGNVTLTTTGYFKRLTSLVIPAQSGAAGTFTLGVSILDSSVTLADFVGFALYDAAQTAVVIPNTAGTAEYQDTDTVSVLVKGALWVVTEDACVAGGDVYVRTGAGTFSQLGAVRSDSDSSSAIQITGARFGRDSAIGALNIIELY